MLVTVYDAVIPLYPPSSHTVRITLTTTPTKVAELDLNTAVWLFLDQNVLGLQITAITGTVSPPQSPVINSTSIFWSNAWKLYKLFS